MGAREGLWDARSIRPALLAVLALSACGHDLGECIITNADGTPGPGLGGSVAMSTAHEGQAIVATSCAGGRCHASTAMSDARFGAPAGANFDVVPSANTPAEIARITKASATINDLAEDMWGWIEDETMPPAPPAATGPLSSQQKEAVRNWLACGAEVIAAAPATPTEADWGEIWTALAPKCIGCHNAAGASIGEGFVLGELDDACGSRVNVVETPAVTNDCVDKGFTLVVPGNPSSSLLLQKLRGTQTCGGYMPQTDPDPLSVSNPELVDTIEQWILDGAPPPMGCAP